MGPASTTVMELAREATISVE